MQTGYDEEAYAGERKRESPAERSMDERGGNFNEVELLSDGSEGTKSYLRRCYRGFAEIGVRKVSQKGSHQKWKHPITKRRTVVYYHRGRIIHPKTLETIVEGIGLTMDEFRKWL